VREARQVLNHDWDDRQVTPKQFSPRDSLSEAFRVYRRLFPRAVYVSAAVFGPLAVVDIAHHLVSSWPAQLLALASFVLSLAGPAIVQGAVTELVGNVRDGRTPRPIGAVLRLGRDRVFPLVGALLFYWLGVVAGLVLLIVPGLMIAARWSLLVPVLILEETGLAEARDRSTKLVQERTGAVLGVILVATAICIWPFVLSEVLVDDFWVRTAIGAVASTLAVPFFAVVTTAVYYRLVDAGVSDD
jgi:hypothetical protein